MLDGSYRLERIGGVPHDCAPKRAAPKGNHPRRRIGHAPVPDHQCISKQLLPVYDKPMIYYPLSVLMLAGIREVLIINTPHEQALFQALLGDGSQWGMRIEYAVQPSPDGLAQAYLIGARFVDGQPSCLVLGDNIFHGPGLTALLKRADARDTGATVFGYWVRDPDRYGVAEFDADGRVVGLEEKPTQPRSNYAVTGLYFYDGRASTFASGLKPSRVANWRSPTSPVLRTKVRCTWSNSAAAMPGSTPAPPVVLEASNYIETIEARQGLRVCCPEEIALNNAGSTRRSWKHGQAVGQERYGQYLLGLAERGFVP